MTAWDAIPTDLLWRYALAVIPLALLVAAVTRWIPCRPATRHLLWLTVLAWVIVSPLLPQAPTASFTSGICERWKSWNP